MARWVLVLLFGLLAASVWVVGSAQAQQRHEWVVNTEGDDADGCPSRCSLRAAIEAANESDGGDLIRFARGMTIRPAGSLPPLRTADIEIDASDLGGGVGNAPAVWLEGGEAGDAAGIEIVAARAAVRGIGISGFERYGIGVLGSAAVDAVIEDNWIGMSSDGRRPSPNRLSGVAVIGGASGARIVGNRIGGNSVLDRTGHGIVIGGGGSVDNEVLNNVIGVGVGGAALANDDGILIVDSAQATVIGNVIGFSVVAGIEVRETRVPIEISGNRIGTSGDGGAAGNDVGIFLGPGSVAVRIGSSGGNVVAGNRVGIAVEQGAREMELWNNWIGLVPRGEGMAAADLPRARIVPNRERGISIIAGASNVRVVSNVIAAGEFGIVVGDERTSRVSLTRNVVAGARSGRTEAAIDVQAGTEIVIGGERALGNHICGAVVALRMSQTEDTSIRGNSIGPDVATRVTFDSDATMGAGIELGVGVRRATVRHNAIAGATGAGIAVTGHDARDNELTENRFGSNGIDIDLGGDGPTSNDRGDGDQGPNGLLNYPTIETHTVVESGFNQLKSTFVGRATPGAHVQLYVLDRERMSPFARTSWAADASGRWEAVTLELPAGSIRALAVSRTRATSEFSPLWEPSRRVKSRSGVSRLVWRGAETAIEEAFGGRLAAMLNTVWRWDGASQSWQGWSPGIPGSSLERVRHGDVLRVDFRRGAPENFFMPPRGLMGGAAAVPLYQGLNEVSWLGERIDAVEALLKLNDSHPRLLSVVWQWDDVHGQWRVVWPRLGAAWSPPPWTSDGEVRLLIRASGRGLWIQTR